MAKKVQPGNDRIAVHGRSSARPPRQPRWWMAGALGVLAIAAGMFVDLGVPTVGSVTTTTTTSVPEPETLVFDQEPWWWGSDWTGPPPRVSISPWETVGEVPDAQPFTTASVAADGTIVVGRGIRPGAPTSLLLYDRYRGYDRTSGRWRESQPLPAEWCAPWFPFVIPVAGDVLVLGFGENGCTAQHRYNLATDEWSVIDHPRFPGPASWGWLASSGSLLIDPFGLTIIDWESGDTTDLPLPPSFESNVMQGRVHGLAAGDRIILIAARGVFSWGPGDLSWESLDTTVRSSDQIGGSWTSEGLLVIGGVGLDPLDGHPSDAGARFFDGDGWRQAPGLTWSGECFPQVIRSSIPLVRICNGYFMWDAVAQRWAPFSAASMDQWQQVVETDGELLTFDRSVHRLHIEHDESGRILVPPTVPIGPVYLEVPTGFAYVEHQGPEHLPLGQAIGSNSTLGLSVAHASGVHCEVAVTMWATEADSTWLQGLEVREGVGAPRQTTVVRPWGVDRDVLDGQVAYTDDGAVGVGVSSGLPDSYRRSILVTCPDAGEEAVSLATLLAGGLWAPDEGRYFFSTDHDPDQPILIRYFSDGREVGGEVVPFRELPDRDRSVIARERFARCIDDAVGGGGVALSQLSLIVTKDDELLFLSYQAVRPYASPPVARISDSARLECLAEAGVGLRYVDERRSRGAGSSDGGPGFVAD